MIAPIHLRAGLRSMPLTDPVLNGEVACPCLVLEPSGANPYTETFRLMARDLAYDIAEVPLVTLAMAVDAGQPIRALPVILAGTPSHYGSLVCLATSELAGPEDLRGRRIGVRSYAQTTGVWVRGVLQHEFGVDLETIAWLVTEDAHVADFVDPPQVKQIPPRNLIEMLRKGELDAVIASPQGLGSATDLRTVIPNARAAGRDWGERLGVHCVNHVLAIRTDVLARDPRVADELSCCFLAARAIAEKERAFMPYGDEPNRRSVDLLLAYSREQGLLKRPYVYDDLFLPWLGTAPAS